ncbi:cation transporter [Kangiella profundi]|uniref:Cation transporter n=1 Tax=Kangiella profundi TaxID=1561924 RepID=A0A2K9A3B0_9GAMM|nr:Na+/H+ antiporter subunit E [Kangiella profundi]AUD78355.1 cation transporter [Kangiella profundi]MBD3667117.1 Na+/H+ antiporter subunit E [Kangiella sp.]GGF07283.1 sodium:proton antiporter [Kangiella profundi]
MTIKSSRYTISLIIVLSLIWIGNSGFYNAMLLSFGAVSVLFVVFVAHRLNIVDEESQPLQISRRIFAYWMWLLKEIVQSNIQVIKRIWSGPKSISPVVMQLKMSQQTDMGKTIYGNSVTLTPGTVTLDIEDDVMTVYALTYDSIQYLQGGEMDRRVKRLED